jgi:hypothetical protein
MLSEPRRRTLLAFALTALAAAPGVLFAALDLPPFSGMRWLSAVVPALCIAASAGPAYARFGQSGATNRVGLAVYALVCGTLFPFGGITIGDPIDLLAAVLGLAVWGSFAGAAWLVCTLTVGPRLARGESLFGALRGHIGLLRAEPEAVLRASGRVFVAYGVPAFLATAAFVMLFVAGLLWFIVIPLLVFGPLALLVAVAALAALPFSLTYARWEKAKLV